MQPFWPYIDALLPKGSPVPGIDLLCQMMRDYPARGGKGLRGQLLLECAAAFGVGKERALPLAAALELFQSWVLIHDDIEDASEERRGGPALHRLHGIPLAINAGDALHAYMWQAVLSSAVPGAAEEFLSTVQRTAEGQHIELLWIRSGTWSVSSADYLQMVQLKTAHYTVVAPLRLGMLAAGVQPDARLLPAGLALGAAFQICDDALNLTGGPTYGKERAGDLLEGKRTLILLDWLASAGEADRQRALDWLGRPRAEKDQAGLAWLEGQLRGSGAVERAMEVAATEARRGLGILAEVWKAAPHPERTLALQETLAGLADRTH